jgi:hypothetical protein
MIVVYGGGGLCAGFVIFFILFVVFEFTCTIFEDIGNLIFGKDNKEIANKYNNESYKYTDEFSSSDCG